MRNDLSEFTKVLTSFSCFSLILISNNSELAAKYLSSKGGQTYKNKVNLQKINKSDNNLKSDFEI